MFDSTLDFITQAASSSLFIFFFCNLIIVIILMGSKPASESELVQQTETVPLKIVTNTNTNTNTKDSCNHVMHSNHIYTSKGASTHFSEAFEDYEDVGDDEDELRRRVEEFIEKINQGWKAESMRTSITSLV